MKVLFDTSVLIAAMLPDHKAHTPAAAWLSKAKAGSVKFCISGHSLAEIYAVLTRLPRKPKISATDAQRLLHENVVAHATIVTLSSDDYLGLIDELAKNGLIGGVVYDGVIAKAAELAKVDHLLTLDLADFQRVWPAGASLVASPDTLSPPAKPSP